MTRGYASKPSSKSLSAAWFWTRERWNGSKALLLQAAGMLFQSPEAKDRHRGNFKNQAGGIITTATPTIIIKMSSILRGKKARLLAYISLFRPETEAVNFKLSSTPNWNWAAVSFWRYLRQDWFVGGFYTSRIKETWRHKFLSERGTASSPYVSR